MATIGLLHPGEMGAAVGGCLVSVGHEVLWDPAGRSRASTGRALAAGLTGVTFDALIKRSLGDLVDLPAARGPRRRRGRWPPPGTRGSTWTPTRSRSPPPGRSPGSSPRPARPTSTAGSSACRPRSAGHTRLYLSGPRANEVRVLFARSALDARIAEGPLYAASAVKMAYAAWTKGSSALLLAARALARAEGVERTLLAEWSLSQPALAARSEGAAASAAAKGWRWVAEMEEIAASMTAAGLPAGFHEAAADIYDRASQADAPDHPPPRPQPKNPPPPWTRSSPP